MGGFKILKNLEPKGTFLIILIILWILCCFIFTKVNQARAQCKPPIEPLTATLTIQRTDCDQQADLVNTVSLDFGFDPNKIQLKAVAPQPPGRCIWAFFDQDPNITGFTALDEDSNKAINDLNNLIDSYRGFWEGWQKAIFPLPNTDQYQRWEATWGIRISYPDLIPNDPDVASLKISWSPDELISGPLHLQISDKKIDMHKQSEVEGDVEEGEILKIEYDYSYGPNSVLGIVCVGGMINEAERRGNFRAFTHLGDWTYKNLKTKISDPEENIRYIFFKEYHDIDGDGSNDCFHDNTDNTINQKEKIKNSIKEWVWGKWEDTRPKTALLIIYLVDHGLTNGEIYIDPYENDPDNQKVTAKELNEWLKDLEDNLLMSNIFNYEILIIIEACYSKSFFEELQSDCRVFIASAAETEEAELSYHGRDSFSHYFWQKIGNEQYEIKGAFTIASGKVSEKQNPFFWPEDVPPKREFLFDLFGYGREPIIIPNIIAVDPNFQHIDHFGYKAKFTVYADRPINKAWAAIIAPGCSNEWCRFYSNPNECYHEEDDEKSLSFSPNYYFFDPNTEVCFYVQGDKTEVSGAYYLDPNLLEECIPISPDPNTLLDEYEPDDNPDKVKGLAGELQIHSFHDSNDVDWIKFLALPDTTYDIELILLYPLSIDPNIIPFQVTIFTPEEKIENIEFRKTFQQYLYENTSIDNARTYIRKWIHSEDEAEIIYLKITPKEKHNSLFLYRLHIISVTAPTNCYIFSALNKETKEKIKEGVLDLYLLDELDEDQNRFLPKWIKSNLIDEYYPCDPKYFYFHLQSEHAQSSIYNLYMGGERRGPYDKDINCYTDLIIWLDPNTYFSGAERPLKNCDLDCDGRPDFQEPYYEMSSDYREIILHSGMNVFHYPFWAINLDNQSIEIPAVNLYNIFYNPNATFYNQYTADLLKICTFPKKENVWHSYDNQNPSEILLNNTSGCLIYLNSIQDNNILSLPNDTESGNCFREVLDDDPKKAKISLYPGLNLVGLIGYKTLFDSFIPIGSGYFDSFSASYSLDETASDTNSMSFSSIMRYDHNQGKWQHSSPFFGRATGEKFPLKPYEGYLIYMKNIGNPNNLKKIIWMPHQTLKDINYKIITERK